MTSEDIPKIFKKYALKPRLSGIKGHTFMLNGSKLEICHKKKALLDETIKAVANKHDSVCVYTGYEGTGKTSDAFIDAAYLASECGMNFNLDQIHFLPEDIEKAVITSPVGTVHVWDEAILGLDSADTLSSVSKALKKVFTVCRSRRQFVFLIIPNIWMLNKYFATVRTRFIVHHISPDGVDRGFYRVYGRKNKSVLYNYGKKSYSYSGKKGLYTYDFEGRFIDPFNLDIVGKQVIDHKPYEEKKQNALEMLNKDTGDKKPKKNKYEVMYRKRCFYLLNYMRNDLKYQYKQIAPIMGITVKATQEFYNAHKELNPDDLKQATIIQKGLLT